MLSSPPHSSRCLVFAFRASQEGALSPAFGSSLLWLCLRSPGAPLAGPGCGAQLMSHPLRTPRPASHTHESTTAAPFWISREPGASGKSSELSPSRRAACSIPAAGSWLVLRRSARGLGDKWLRRHEKRKERRSDRIKPAPGLDFCLLSKRCARRGEAQPGLRREAFPGVRLPPQLRGPDGISSRTDTARCWCTDPRQGRRRCRCCTPKAAPVLLPPTF